MMLQRNSSGISLYVCVLCLLNANEEQAVLHRSEECNPHGTKVFCKVNLFEVSTSEPCAMRNAILSAVTFHYSDQCLSLIFYSKTQTLFARRTREAFYNQTKLICLKHAPLGLLRCGLKPNRVRLWFADLALSHPACVQMIFRKGVKREKIQNP